jgi:hypothetical protein
MLQLSGVSGKREDLCGSPINCRNWQPRSL